MAFEQKKETYPWVEGKFGSHKREEGLGYFDAFEENVGYLPFVGHEDFHHTLGCKFDRIVRVDSHSFRRHLLGRPPRGEVGMLRWGWVEPSGHHSKKWDGMHVGMESVPVGIEGCVVVVGKEGMVVG